MLSGVQNTYSGFFFITLEDWAKRKKPEEQYKAIMAHLNREFGKIPGAIGFAFPPPAIPGVGTSGGVTFILEDRSGKGMAVSGGEPEEVHGGGAASARNWPACSPPRCRPCRRCM